MLKICIGDGAGLALPAVEVGRGSAFEALLVGVPARYENVQVAFGLAGDTVANPCPCSAKPGGEWGVYASAAFFPNEGRAHYHVTARTGRGDSVYLGRGTLRIVPSVLNVEGADVPIVPEDFCVRNPVTGLWHRVFAEANEDGDITMTVQQEGFRK